LSGSCSNRPGKVRILNPPHSWVSLVQASVVGARRRTGVKFTRATNHCFDRLVSRAETIGAVWLLLGCFLCVRLPFIFLTNNASGDAWQRYQIGLVWSVAPNHVPSLVWLPMHFWILGVALRAWKTELMARLVSLLFGILTVFPLWGLVRRSFGVGVAVWSALSVAMLGIHIGYSVNSSSEATTVFFLVVGVYAWIRFRHGDDNEYVWAVLSGLALSAACLCRYEPVIAVIVLAALGFLPRDTVRGAVILRGSLFVFVITASAGFFGWCAFSYLKWHDPFFHAHHTMALNSADPIVSEQTGLYRLFVVPAAMVASLGPLALLAPFGIRRSITRIASPKAALAILALALMLSHYANAVLHYVTQARYILIYVWLWVPFAYEGMGFSPRRLESRWNHRTVAILFMVFLVWQTGITAAAQFGPPWLADRLGRVAPTLPFRTGLRHLIVWMSRQPKPHVAAIVDNFNYEATFIVRFTSPGCIFTAPDPDADTAELERNLIQFIQERHPHLLVYSPKGRLSEVLSISRKGDLVTTRSGLSFHLHRLWQENETDYSAYEIDGMEDRRPPAQAHR
jgi:hypothetical protein